MARKKKNEVEAVEAPKVETPKAVKEKKPINEREIKRSLRKL